MNVLAEIKAPLKEDFERYSEFMKTTLSSESEFVSDIVDYIIANAGKGIRPLLVMLFAGIHSPSGVALGKRNYLAAVLVELIHTASLVHDDVVDESPTRHGKPTVNSVWNSKVSVLIGDYILAKSFSVGMQSGQFDIVSYISGSMAALAEGELMQSDTRDKMNITRERYLDIIYRKTATLLGVCCGGGALSANATSQQVTIARQIGLNLGMAFQIKDDILDYAPQGQTGKPFCADLREKKITLPLLAVMERGDELTKKLIITKLENIDENPDEVQHIYDIVVNGGGLSAAEEVMDDYLNAARSMIEVYPESEYRQSLLMLCDYIGAREK